MIRQKSNGGLQNDEENLLDLNPELEEESINNIFQLSLDFTYVCPKINVYFIHLNKELKTFYADINNLMVNFKNTPKLLTGDFSLNSSFYYYNNDKKGWEPFIEPFSSKFNLEKKMFEK